MKDEYVRVNKYYNVNDLEIIIDKEFKSTWRTLLKNNIRVVKIIRLNKEDPRDKYNTFLDEDWVKEKYNIEIAGWRIYGYNNSKCNAFTTPPFNPYKGNII